MHRPFVTLIAISIIAIGCEGPEGPVGPAGEDGQPGPEGPQGPPGEIESQTYTYTIADADVDGDEILIQIPESAPAITQDVLDGGVVLAFYSGNDGTRWVAMPFVLSVGGSALVISYALEVETFIIQITDDAGIASSTGGDQVRVFILPASVDKVGIDFSDYETVASQYGLQ